MKKKFLRLAFLGNAESGKSTLCGVLTQGVLDNGQGKSRLNIFRHLHEFRSGRTSSVCLEFIGFSATGKVILLSLCLFSFVMILYFKKLTFYIKV